MYCNALDQNFIDFHNGDEMSLNAVQNYSNYLLIVADDELTKPKLFKQKKEKVTQKT